MFITPAQYPAGDGETKEPEDSETKKPTECQVQAGRLGVRRQPEGDDSDSEKRLVVRAGTLRAINSLWQWLQYNRAGLAVQSRDLDHGDVSVSEPRLVPNCASPDCECA